MPARPANVSGRAPAASPSRDISASPRVISDAFELSPRLEPVDAARGERDHVLRGGAELDADDVGVHYVRKTVELIACCSCPAR